MSRHNCVALYELKEEKKQKKYKKSKNAMNNKPERDYYNVNTDRALT